ncbi:MAG TPA: 16S rRNA (adenine(1518)-N(6)/adenine(1519)-N(6))-dimethyltransferase RsmA [Polyangiaceae bacterium]|nr:16S rRNA (adenine(1518)-N(6)/adenine(1519)-N(6))-dimethyltransferase RsmA [Polyangiaceae bacterium]
MSITEILRARGLSPKKRFGQNFLTDPRTCEGIAAAAAGLPSLSSKATGAPPSPEGTVLEIGAGLGALTRPLCERAAHVIAIERDRDLVPILREQLAQPIAEGRLELVEADATQVDWTAALAPWPKPHGVAGNLPYLLTGMLLEQATHAASAIDRAVFMVQLEVAERLAARPGSESYGALSVFVQAAFDVRRIFTVRAGSFYPRPEVDSAVVLLVPHRPRRAEETKAFSAAVRAAFGARRKTLRNAWKGLYGWSREELTARAEEAGISLDARGETLSVEEFARMAALAPASAKGSGQGP